MRAHPAGALHGDTTVPTHPLGPPPADLGALDPQIWPLSAERVGGVMHLGGCDVRAVVAEHGSPAYLLVEDDARARCRAYRAAFGDDTDIYYAAKAFLSKRFAQWIAEENLSLDVASGGELATALAGGFPADRILMHGNNKSPEELAAALAAGVGRVVLDSDHEIARLAHAADAAGVRQQVLVRVTVGVEAHTHEFIATAHEDQKFGFSLASGAALEAVRRVSALPSLELVGLHSHIGSQIFDTAGFEVAAHRVVGLLASIRDALGLTLPELDLGGGLGIAYTRDDDPAAVSDVAKQLRAIVERECAAASLPVPRLAVEPGRAIVGPAGISVYEVGTIKALDGLRTYVSVDGGMSDNIRTALYDASYTCVLASRDSDAPPMLARVVGKHCEAGDVVVRDVWLPSDLAPGDLLAVAATGAYCRSMASNYNAVPRPPVVAVKDGKSSVLLRRETFDDLLALDLG
ncbi:MAG TPA: diaminopimelate decarboxylase [Mycobacteriales bacterium]|jgi:diaminopimelate decarboxylase|nr:diaminopimelate decarboxylase [Mycobacteriales bacterium]